MTTFELFRFATWRQFGAAIDMLENAMEACPESLWADTKRNPQFWYLVFHTLWWLDYDLDESPDTFRPPAPYTLDELDPNDVRPALPYTRDQMRKYLSHGRAKCRTAFETLTEEQAMQRSAHGRYDRTVMEMMVYNLRHVQHHAAQLNLILRQVTDSAPRWVSHAGQPLNARAKEPA